MPSKKPAVVIEHDDSQSDGAINEVANLAAEHSQQIMATYGDGLPYERSRLVRETQFYMEQSAMTMLEAGKRILILKEHEAHGEFTQIVEQQLGINARTAQRMMQSSLKYLSPKLASKASALTVLNKSKLLELMAEDDDDLAALADGGTIAGHTLDEIDRMSSRELRAALRKAREEHDDQQRVMEDKNKKIDEQSKKINRIRRQDPDETVTQMRTEISAMQSNIEHDIRTNFFNAINELQTQEGGDHNAFIESQLKLLEDSITHLKESFLTAGWES